MVRLAIIGDLHGVWSDFDIEYLNASDYDGVLFVGDLGRGDETSRRLAAEIGRIERPTLVLPGNADAPHAAGLRAEFTLERGLAALFGDDDARTKRARAWGGVRLCGYSLHRPGLTGLDFTILAARPFSQGGPELTFKDELSDAFGIDSLEASRRRLFELVDRAETDDILFLSHNGPTGLGDAPTDPWGADFLSERVDWGDPDLEHAVAYARSQGRRVLAVIGGHMHLRLKGLDQERVWRRRHDDVLYVNPARVPRIGRGERDWHHHVSLEISAEGVVAEEVFVEP